MARQRKDESVRRQEDSQVSAPECPVCLDQMLPPLRIFQCRDTMTGRATGTEKFLRTIHQLP